MQLKFNAIFDVRAFNASLHSLYLCASFPLPVSAIPPTSLFSLFRYFSPTFLIEYLIELRTSRAHYSALSLFECTTFRTSQRAPSNGNISHTHTQIIAFNCALIIILTHFPYNFSIIFVISLCKPYKHIR